MKLIHLADLHIGKRVNEFSMIEDQKYILKKIQNIIDDELPTAVLIAGDIYDKSVPSAEAVELFDEFLVGLSARAVKTFVISGNHDSPERMAFGNRLMNTSGVHLSPVYGENIVPITLSDEFGDVEIYMLPFIKPAHVRAVYPDALINSYSDAVKLSIESMQVDTKKRNILITHQFVTGATRCDSEDISVGGSDNVDASIFDSFDYVALGHIHGPQKVTRETIRYCGTPLKYSFSECTHKKSVTVVDFAEKDAISIRTVPLIPKRDMREIKGNYLTLTDINYYKNANPDDYLHVTLTDEDEILDAIATLRVVYPNIMKLDYDNTRTRTDNSIQGVADVENKSPLTLFSEFYQLQNNQAIDEEQTQLLEALIEKIWEDGL